MTGGPVSIAASATSRACISATVGTGISARAACSRRTTSRRARSRSFCRCWLLAAYLTSVKVIKGGPDCEIDFIAIRHWHGEIECAIGEAKAVGGAITDDDVSHLKAVALALRNAGMEAYLVFTKTAQAFTPEELTRMRA